MTLSRGRDVLAIPGPSIVPDRVLNAMHRAAPNIYEGELIEMTATVVADLKRLAGTAGEAVIYIGNGHAVWEAAIANILRPGEKALVLATGRFGLGWAATARQMGIDAEVMDFGFGLAIDPARVEARLRADAAREIRAVLAVQTDTASSVRSEIASLRAALDAAGHPALLAVDCIACLACDRFEMDAWGVDVMVAACQKGLMTPPGLAFTFQGARAMAERVRCPSPYWQAATITSAPSASISKRSEPRLAMQSTARSAGCPAASSAARTVRTSFLTDEAVSVWTTPTMRIAPARSAASRSATRAPSTVSEKPKSITSTSTPICRAVCAQPAPKRPVTRNSALSPGARRLAIDASQAAWPLPM